MEFNGTLPELEARATDGQLNGCIFKARVTSDDPILDLADQLSAWSPDCDVFDLVNNITHREIEAIDTEASPEAEPPLDQLFLEWRSSAARGMKASDDAALAVFREVIGERDAEATPDLGTRAIVEQAEAALAALGGASEEVG